MRYTRCQREPSPNLLDYMDDFPEMMLIDENDSSFEEAAIAEAEQMFAELIAEEADPYGFNNYTTPTVLQIDAVGNETFHDEVQQVYVVPRRLRFDFDYHQSRAFDAFMGLIIWTLTVMVITYLYFSNRRSIYSHSAYSMFDCRYMETHIQCVWKDNK